MWSYNSFYDDPNNILCHSNFKYIDKTYKNGRWIYTYPDDGKGGIIRKDISPDSYSKKKASWRLNPKAMEKTLVGTRLQGRRRIGNIPQNTIDKSYVIESKNKGISEQASKQAEKEHSSKTAEIDRINKANYDLKKEQEERDNNLKTSKKEYNQSLRNLLNSMEEVKQLLKSTSLRDQDIDAAKRKLKENYEDASKKLDKVHDAHGRYLSKEESDEYNKMLTTFYELGMTIFSKYLSPRLYKSKY